MIDRLGQRLEKAQTEKEKMRIEALKNAWIQEWMNEYVKFQQIYKLKQKAYTIKHTNTNKEAQTGKEKCKLKS